MLELSDRRFGIKVEKARTRGPPTGGPKGKSKEAKQVNEFIDSVKFRIQAIINRLNQEEIEISAEILKLKYLRIEQKAKTLLEIFNDHNKNLKTLIGKDFTIGTRGICFSPLEVRTKL